MNRWNIPASLESEVTQRDTTCVYCRTNFGVTGKAGSRESWEHIVNDARIVTRDNIALCCRSCNSSKGAKPLLAWLQSTYCQRRGIAVDSVADVVRRALAAGSAET